MGQMWVTLYLFVISFLLNVHPTRACRIMQWVRLLAC